MTARHVTAVHPVARDGCGYRIGLDLPPVRCGRERGHGGLHAPETFVVTCSICGTIGVPQLAADADAIADRHQTLGGFG